MKTINRMSLAFLVGATLAACSSFRPHPEAPVAVQDGVLTGSNGMTLYTFDKDVAGSGTSMCNGPCAMNWPPVYSMGSDTPSGKFSLVEREDGTKQWAYKGKPLYFWAKDKKPGDRTGDGVNGVWHVARP